MSKYQFLDRRVPIEDGNIALVQDLTKCKNCSLCRKACAVDMGVFDYYDLTTNGDHPICIHCGQCASIWRLYSRYKLWCGHDYHGRSI